MPFQHTIRGWTITIGLNSKLIELNHFIKLMADKKKPEQQQHQSQYKMARKWINERLSFHAISIFIECEMRYPYRTQAVRYKYIIVPKVSGNRALLVVFTSSRGMHSLRFNDSIKYYVPWKYIIKCLKSVQRPSFIFLYFLMETINLFSCVKYQPSLFRKKSQFFFQRLSILCFYS